MSFVGGGIVQCLSICYLIKEVLINYFSFILYFGVLIFGGGLTSILMVLLILEVLSWVFLILLDSRRALKYLLIQGYFILVRLLRLLWVLPLLRITMLLKIGLPPFHSWFIIIAVSLVPFPFLFIRTLHKVLPLFVMTKALLKGALLMIGLRLVFSTFLLIQSSTLFLVLVNSSLVHGSWLVIRALSGRRLIVLYWFSYRILLRILLSSIYMPFLLARSSRGTRLTRASWLVLRGFPPLVIFWLKANIFIVLLSISLLVSLVLAIPSVLALRVYFRAYHLRLRTAEVAFWWAFPIVLILGGVGII